MFFIFLLGGCAFLGTGIWIVTDQNASKVLHIATLDANGLLFEAAAITLITVGSIIFLTGLFGCCGAIRESPSVLLLVGSLISCTLDSTLQYDDYLFV